VFTDPQFIPYRFLLLYGHVQHFREKPEIDTGIDQSDDKQHLHWRKTQLPLAADIITDEIPWAIQ